MSKKMSRDKIQKALEKALYQTARSVKDEILARHSDFPLEEKERRDFLGGRSIEAELNALSKQSVLLNCLALDQRKKQVSTTLLATTSRSCVERTKHAKDNA
jgi:hypothetical protein